MLRFAYFIGVLSAVGIVISTIDLIHLMRKSIEFKNDAQSVIDRTEGWMKGYLAGDKEFAEYLKKNNPELFKKIESL